MSEYPDYSSDKYLGVNSCINEETKSNLMRDTGKISTISWNLDKRFSKFTSDRKNTKQRAASKDPRAKIKSMEVFIQNGKCSSPFDMLDWYLSVVNTVIKSKNLDQSSSSVKALSQDEKFDVRENPGDKSHDYDTSELKDVKWEDFPYFESIRLSTTTFKGSAKNAKIGELVTPDTKVNSYFNAYHIILCIDASKSMHNYDSGSGKMLFDKVREVVNATLFNLKCSITKNDKINRESFLFNPKISLTVLGAGIPDISHTKHYEGMDHADYTQYYNSPNIIFYHDVDQEEIWKLIKKVNSQINRIENMMRKYYQSSAGKNRAENLDQILQELVFVINKRENGALPVVLYVTDSETANQRNDCVDIDSTKSIVAQLNRMDAKFIVVSVTNENDYKQEFGCVSNHAKLKLLAMMTKGYYLTASENVINLDMVNNKQYCLKDFMKYAKFEDDSAAKIERTNK